jgi:Outer membrane protein beta-barrel domain
MQALLLLSLMVGVCTNLAAQKKLLVGGNIGTATTYMLQSSEKFEGGSGFFGSVHFDYQITSRLSINTQLQYQREKYKALPADRLYQDVQLHTQRLLAGITEYLPMGNHAAYINLGLTLSHHSATGNVAGNTNSVKPFDQQGFRPWQLGGGLHLGYMFRFGLSLQTGFMFDFTPAYRGNGGKLRHQQFQLLQLGYLPGFNKRDRIDRWKQKKKGR